MAKVKIQLYVGNSDGQGGWENPVYEWYVKTIHEFVSPLQPTQFRIPGDLVKVEGTVYNMVTGETTILLRSMNTDTLVCLVRDHGWVLVGRDYLIDDPDSEEDRDCWDRHWPEWRQLSNIGVNEDEE